MSYGGYEARVGTPKLLELIDQLDLKATFFVTGRSVDVHPAMAESILRAGHEIGHHGHHHLLPDPGDPWIEEERERGFEALKRRDHRALIPDLVEFILPDQKHMLLGKNRPQGFVWIAPYVETYEDGRDDDMSTHQSPCGHSIGLGQTISATYPVRAFGFVRNRQFGECQATYAIA